MHAFCGKTPVCFYFDHGFLLSETAPGVQLGKGSEAVSRYARTKGPNEITI